MKTRTGSLIRLLKVLKRFYKSEKSKGIRKKRGRPIFYTSRAMNAVFLVMMIKGIRSFKGVHKFLKTHPLIRKYCGLERLPDRATLSRRLRRFFSEMLKGRSYIWETTTEK